MEENPKNWVKKRWKFALSRDCEHEKVANCYFFAIQGVCSRPLKSDFRAILESRRCFWSQKHWILPSGSVGLKARFRTGIGCGTTIAFCFVYEAFFVRELHVSKDVTLFQIHRRLRP
jgi:hypothetical protein